MASGLLYPVPMTFNPGIHHRRSIRLRHYDYTKPGAYFVTICIQNQECLLGHIADGQIILSDMGLMVESVWNELPQRYTGIDTDAFTIMPNHIHGIITIVGAALALPPNPAVHKKGAASGAPTLGDMIRVFKSISAIRVNHLLPHYGQPLWQRNYYEHIIRNEEELNRIREYIQNNPLNWEMDEENPERT